MFGLLRLLANLGPVFVFFLLEAISLFLIISYNDQQGKIFFSSANRIAGNTLERYDKAVNYYGLPERYDSMLRVNARLLEQLPNSYYDNKLIRDTSIGKTEGLESIPLYTALAAQVIKNSVNQNHNFITLNKGRKHGIQPNMGVITNNGVVGVVRASSKHYSLVMSMLNTDFRISASALEKGYFGRLIWKGGDPRYMYLVDIPKHHLVEVGDEIVTFSNSTLFPPGTPIGRVENFSMPPGESYYEILVRLNIDLSRVQHAYIIDHLFKEELEALEKSLEE